MPIDGILINALVGELRRELLDGKITKVYQPERDEIWLTVRTSAGDRRLLISASGGNPRIHITEHQKENPKTPPMFCMLLRKLLISGRIVDISQKDMDRVVVITVESRNELHDLTTKQLICEIMGRHSNIILVQDGIIIDAIRHVDLTVSRMRMVLPGLAYDSPPPQNKLNPLECSEAQIKHVFDHSNNTIEKTTLQNFAGTSPLFSREIANRNEAPHRILYEEFQKIKRGEFKNILIYDKTKESFIDFACYPVEQYGDGVEIIELDSTSHVLDRFYHERDSKERLRQRGSHLHKLISTLIDRSTKKIATHMRVLEDCKKKDRHRICGDLLIGSIANVPIGASKVVVPDYYNDYKPVEIALDPKLSPQKNAAKYYKKYQKAKVAEVMAAEQLAKCKNELVYLESVLYSIENAADNQAITDIKDELVAQGYIKEVKKQKPTQQKVKIQAEMVDGFEVYAGKNNRENDYITFKVARANDMWLHAKDIPGAHVVIKTNGEQIPDKVLEKAAEIAAKHSKNKNNSTCLVDYTLVKNVRKPKGAKPGMVIYVNYKTAVIK